MKKQLFVLTAALAAMVTVVRAEVATLKHGDELTVYYAADALKNALDDAVAGDVINLSSGFFNISSINKAVTIIGAGMETDLDNNIQSTTLVNGSSSISIKQPDEEASLKFEGLRFNSNVTTSSGYAQTLYYLTFTRCKFEKLFTTESSYPLFHANFVNCVFNSTSDNYFYGSSSFINCYIRNLYHYGAVSCVNCVIGLAYYASDYSDDGFMNCIIVSRKSSGSDYLQNVQNCIATTNSAYPVQGASNYTNEQIFKTFRGSYTDGERFELTDEGKQILGMDGTEVGMQGGYIPFDPTPSNIQIERCTVDKQTDANGKLNVSIKLREKKTDDNATQQPTE